MNNAGLHTTIEEGKPGQFELFKDNALFLKGGGNVPKFFTLEDVQRRLGESGEY